MVTSYDYWSAKIIEGSAIDCVLVGDSCAMVMHGFPSTVNATVEMIAFHTAAVARALKTKFLVADMPFLSVRKGLEPAMSAVEKLMQAGAQAVKIEGVWGHEDVVRQVVQSGVPVMGHIGLTPQSIHQFGGFKVQGKSEAAARDLLAQARRLEELGCFSLVLECVPAAVAAEITQALSIPTIGIGAGLAVDGQVLVLQDLLGMSDEFKPKFLKHFLAGHATVQQALDRFAGEAREGTYPGEKEIYL